MMTERWNVQQTLPCTADTSLYSRHFLVQQTLPCTADTSLYSRHFLVRSTKACVSGGLTAVILRSVLDGVAFSYRPWPLYPLRKRLQHALYRRQGPAQGCSGILSGEGIFIHVGNGNTTLLSLGPWQLAS